MIDYTLPPLPAADALDDVMMTELWEAASVERHGQQCAEAARAPLLRALQHIAVELQQHFDGVGLEVSSSYHHAVMLPKMVRAALLGTGPDYAVDEDDAALLDRFMRDEQRDRPDRIVEMLREQRARIAELEADNARLRRKVMAQNKRLRKASGDA